ncbi:hypothetical protein KIL84_002691 [Mauremys mutica]|uniref:Uncharacterized protein n=1 Tax=Mauremys mutica TaxID=74926 RepID=A0A9D3WV21_9SAUR|nr:hypothetical protein KIL84_002691 [Mauremys mutica]
MSVLTLGCQNEAVTPSPLPLPPHSKSITLGHIIPCRKRGHRVGGFCPAMSMEGGRLPPLNHHYLPPLAQPHGDQFTGLCGSVCEEDAARKGTHGSRGGCSSPQHLPSPLNPQDFSRQ